MWQRRSAQLNLSHVVGVDYGLPPTHRILLSEVQSRVAQRRTFCALDKAKGGEV